MVIGNGYKWILLQPEGYITGLYHEKVRSGMAIMRLGVIGEGTFHLHLRHTLRSDPVPGKSRRIHNIFKLFQVRFDQFAFRVDKAYFGGHASRLLRGFCGQVFLDGTIFLQPLHREAHFLVFVFYERTRFVDFRGVFSVRLHPCNVPKKDIAEHCR